MPAPAGKLASGKPFSEAYVLPTAGFRPVRRHSAGLPLCTKPMSGGNAEETEIYLTGMPSHAWSSLDAAFQTFLGSRV
jgi:hypothetical protein